MAQPKFPSVQQSFHTILKKRVQEYFQSTGKPSTGTFSLYFKAALLVCSFIAIYIHLVFFTPTTWLAIGECVVLGGVTAAIGFNVMHDGGHGSFSRYKWVNRVAALSLNFLGGNDFMWHNQHNIIHHAYTNVEGIDEDIHQRPWFRFNDQQERYKLHKYQHLYCWILYALQYLMWIFMSDFKKYFTKKIHNVTIKKMSRTDHIVFWTFKVLFYSLFIFLPLWKFGFLGWLGGFLIFTCVTGFIISIVFQLAHTVEHTHFPMPDEATNKMQDEWAIHQLKTTANFATRNKLVCWLVGGLNFQVEHHLFPKISHVHYPRINKIIRNTCVEFGVEYIEYRHMRDAIRSHYNHLKELGRK
jgi:linoleoyl-CoA desaturase